MIHKPLTFAHIIFWTKLTLDRTNHQINRFQNIQLELEFNVFVSGYSKCF